MTSRVIEVHENSIHTIDEEVYPKVLYFTAKWCGPCQRIQSIYDQLASNHPDVKFFKIDVDKNQDLTSSFGVKSMPTFFFFKSVSEYTSFTGADPNKLDRYIRLLKNVI